MKIILSLLLTLAPAATLAFNSLTEQATYFQSLYNNPPSHTAISKSKMFVEETRPKAVLKGVFYFGGTDNEKKQILSSGYQQLLCTEGFSQVYSVYTSVNKQITCNGRSLSYDHIGEAFVASDGGDKVSALMERIHGIIKANGSQGPIYLHCFYGVHASNTIAQMVLKQFCDISDSQALSNWDKVDLYDSLKEPGTSLQAEKILAFQPDPSLRLSAAEKAVVCY